MKCEFCQNHEQGDTLYEPSDWDGDIGFDYIRDIKYCPLCGRMLNAESEKPNNCETCRHWWKSEDVCLLDDCHYEPKDEPQTDEEYINNLPWTEVGNGEKNKLQIERPCDTC